MSLESFAGLDQGEGMSEAAFEIFKEKMKRAAAQIAAIKKEEKKQKKKEHELLKILLKFVKTSHKSDLVLLISRVLEENIPANFVLAIVLLGNEDIQKEVGHFLMLKPGEATPDEKALIFFTEDDKTTPLKTKIEIDNWLKNLMVQADETPQKLVEKSYKIEFIREEDEYGLDAAKVTKKRTLKMVVVQLMTYVLRDFLEQNKVHEPYDKLYEFCHFIFKGIVEKTEESLDNRKELKGEVEEL